ncbi:ATP-binding cassette domain-containing protein [Bartonella sp. M0280]|uniref:ATP-binding cassette domain-containing protein n=1 Tax=Bartonella apihabitans TaxID=2750929 RepID=UPI0018DC381C|nr:ATP-binding cassette domain-containing protein [Bartonella apihabitans]MBI0168519.1 ATP-binding cassette domain-containing protein [Bartonella apihabitans]
MLKTDAIDTFIAGTQILRSVNVDMAINKTVGMIGRNGAGKTTFMRAIMGVLPVTSGSIFINGKDVTKAPAHIRVQLGVGYMPEDRRLIPEFTVEENILLPLDALGKTRDRQRLEWIYELMPEIARFADRKAITLSGGQQKLVSLGRALIIGRSLLLLDEPFEGVAPALAQRLIEVIAALKSENMTILLTESDHVHSESLLDELYVIERGHVEHKTMK